MYSVLLADDEKMGLISTENSFDWLANGFEVVCKTTNPHEAVEVLSNKRIDAAFLDIRMPELSGFDIINLCQQSKLATQFVMTTGYSDFAYAKQAIRLNVFDYCLKPIQADEIAGLLPKLSDVLFQNRLAYDREYINGLIKSEDTAKVLEYLGLDCMAQSFCVIGIRCSNLKRFSHASYTKSQIHLICDNRCALIICSDEANVIERLETVVRENLHGACILLGTACDRVDLIPQSVQMIASRLQTMPEAPKEELIVLQGLSNSQINKSVLSLIEYIDKHFSEDLVLQQLADKFNINYTYCSDLFKKATGTNFSIYLTNLRIKNACRLLRNSDTGIAEISYDVGYNDYHYFAWVFKKAVGITPSQYREHTGEGAEDEI